MKKYLLLLLVPILSFANIGKVTVVKGDVNLDRDGQSIKVTSGTILEKKDFIKTKKNGKVQIVFTDNTIFTVGKNSTLDIADYLYDESQPKKNKVQLNVLKGAFSSITGRIGKLNKSKFKLKTKSASIGIRGTIVKADQENIMCTEGAISVTSNNGITVRVESGYKTNVSSGVPAEPEIIKEGDEQLLDLEVTLEANEEVKVEITDNDVKIVPNDPNEDTKQVTEQATTTEIKDIVTKNIVLEGRTINSEGQQQLLTIDAQNIKDDLTIEGQDAVMTDNSGNEIKSATDDTITWGYWATDSSKKWVAGQTTQVQVLDSLRDDSATVDATYKGQVMGTVNGTDDIKIDTNNEVNMNFKLGGGENKMDGDIKFDTQAGQAWNSSFDGTTSGNTFTNTTINGTSDDKAIQSGSVDGTFYGDNAQAVGGTFELNTEADKATGVFKATK
ncbi:MAG: FecR domain-containing protein [Campylobacterota bacterium]|nr:FecR domain-containing protein [Campylobacterota bacterium]